ncbi:MAG: DUF2723 domain-containing protein [Caldilineaceae bacterium]|nr:DUF2723 domain-containing protein [Caldilineaceae bacterium]
MNTDSVLDNHHIKEVTEPVKFPLADHNDRQIALLLAAVALALYLRTLAPDLLPGDPGEFQFAAWRFGLAHPTGYPFYLLAGGVWQRLLAPAGISPAAALNGLSAALAAAAVGMTYLVMLRWTAGPPALRRLAAVYSAVLLGTNLTFWSQALIAEVYAPHMVLVLGVLLAAQRLAPSAPGLPRAQVAARPLLILAGVVGLALTHHGMALLLMPGLALYLAWAGTGWRDLPRRVWVAAAALLLAPLLLYLYIPLRAGPEASPWLHQRLGDGTLDLYANTWAGFLHFLTGQSISVGFRDLAGALGQLPQAGWLWRYHFSWVGLVMMALGIGWLVRQRAWPVLALTGSYALLQQVFVLFYNIGDILVYYIPLYAVGALWAGFGLLGLSTGWRTVNALDDAALREIAEEQAPSVEAAPGDGAAAQPPTPAVGGLAVAGRILAGLLLLWALRDVAAIAGAIDQSQSHGARRQWDAILAAQPPTDAILVSNDRNEIVPLFYLQNVEQRGQGMTGLFPLIAPDARFADIGATLDTALAAGGDQPVYLIKPMSGLEIKYQLAPAAPPLVQVLGPHTPEPAHRLEQPYGPLHLVGYDWQPDANAIRVRVVWQVVEAVGDDYTATAQLLDAAGAKLAQDDFQPGGDYYPTSLWKPGDRLVVEHTLKSAAPLPAGTTLLLGMYRGADFSALAAPVQVPVP